MTKVIAEVASDIQDDDALSNTGIVLLAQEIDDNTFFDVRKYSVCKLS